MDWTKLEATLKSLEKTVEWIKKQLELDNARTNTETKKTVPAR